MLHLVKKPLIWFLMQAKWLVSIWTAMRNQNGLILLLLKRAESDYQKPI